MPRAKFTLSKAQLEFVNRHAAWGFPDRSTLVREALDQMKAHLARQRLAESARIYAEIYAEDKELRALAEAALEDWPE